MMLSLAQLLKPIDLASLPVFLAFLPGLVVWWLVRTVTSRE